MLYMYTWITRRACTILIVYMFKNVTMYICIPGLPAGPAEPVTLNPKPLNP